MEIINKLTEFTESLISGSDIFLIEVVVNPTNIFKIFLDSDTALTVESCAKINRSLRKMVEETEMYPDGDFSIEVSSPGIDKPLKLFRQYKKNIGRTLEIIDQSNTAYLGVMTDATEEKVTLSCAIPKSKEKKVVEIPFDQIKTAEVQIIF